MKFNYNREPSETFKAYKIRICRNKDIYELSWKQIASLLNAETDESKRDESTYRKWWNAYVEGHEDCQREGVSNSVVLEEINKQKQELEMLSQAVRDERAKLNQEKRSLNRTKYIAQCLCETTSPIPRLAPYSIIKPVDKKPRRTLCILHSDGQVGELVTDSDTSGFNRYDLDTFLRRDQFLTQEIINMAHELKINNAVVFELGDSVEGNGRIYKSQRNYLETHIRNQIYASSEAHARFVEGLYRGGISELEVVAVPGNHGLDGYDSHEDANFDFLVYDRAKTLLELYHYRDDSCGLVNYDIAESFMTVHNVLGFNFLCLHGEGMRKTSLSNGFYKYAHMFAERGQPIYAMVSGHWHEYQEKDVGTTAGGIIVNGSIVGTNRLALKRLQADTKPSQTVFIVEEGKGITYRRKVVLPD